MTNRGDETRARIAATALTVLREKGSAGLTMRAVANATGLSLSNVQFHFKTRGDLLEGLTQHHLSLCSEALETAVARSRVPTLRAGLIASLCDEAVLATGPAFRELFALSRSEARVKAKLDAYYAASLDQLTDFLGTVSEAPRRRRLEVASLLITSIEGAYLLLDAFPIAPKRFALRLEEMALAMLG